MDNKYAIATACYLLGLATFLPEAALACEQVDPCKAESGSMTKWIVAGGILLAYLLFEGLRWWWNNVPAVSEIPSDDPRLLRAKQKALLTIEEFWRSYLNPAADEEDFALKIARETEFGTETIWVGEISERKGQWFGRLLNEPISPEFEYGQTIRFEEEQICDWTFNRAGSSIGNFTVAVMLMELSERNRRRVLNDLGWSNSDLAYRLT